MQQARGGNLCASRASTKSALAHRMRGADIAAPAERWGAAKDNTQNKTPPKHSKQNMEHKKFTIASLRSQASTKNDNVFVTQSSSLEARC